MKTFPIKLSTIEDVRNFVNVLSKYTIDLDLRSGRYTVDARSLMGIFSLDLLKPIEFIIQSDDEKTADAVSEDVKQWKV
ncbi:MAG: HPr family phosphocarrier protein [Oscillospiraceae bacterium]|nr:HPr family phosphocarrier protein [Oscillospiraceae bacterium]